MTQVIVSCNMLLVHDGTAVKQLVKTFFACRMVQAEMASRKQELLVKLAHLWADALSSEHIFSTDSLKPCSRSVHHTE